MVESREEILKLTNWFRSTSHPMYSKIRELLIERNIDPYTSVLVEIFSDDTCFEYGIVITKDREIFQFGYDYLRKNNYEGEFTEWEDLTQIYKTRNWHKDIECGLTLV